MATSIWIGDVGAHWVETDLGPWLAQLPGFRDVKLMTRTGYGFIDFVTHEAAEYAMNLLNGAANPIYGGTLRLKWAGSKGKDERGPSSGGPPTKNEYSCFVGGLAPEVDENTLVQFFQARYPSVIGARVVRGPDGLSKGYGFMRLGSQQEQMAAVNELTGAILLGSTIRVTASQAKDAQGGRGGGGYGGGQAGGMGPGGGGRPYGGGQAGGMGGGGGGYGGGMGGGYQQQGGPGGGGFGGEMRAPRQPRIQLPYAPAPAESEGNTTVFVGSIAEGTTDVEIFQAFCMVGPVSSVSVPRGKGCAFVQYQFKQHADAAIRQMSGVTIRGNAIRCSYGKNALRTNNQQQQQQQQGTVPMGSGYMGAPASSAGGYPGPGGAGYSSAFGGAPPPQPPQQQAYSGVPAVGMGHDAAASARPSATGVAQQGSGSAMDVDTAAGSAVPPVLPAEITAAFGSPSVKDAGEMCKPFDAAHANVAYGYLHGMLLGTAGAASLSLSASGLAWTPQAAEAGTVTRA